MIAGIRNRNNVSARDINWTYCLAIKVILLIFKKEPRDSLRSQRLRGPFTRRVIRHKIYTRAGEHLVKICENLVVSRGKLNKYLENLCFRSISSLGCFVAALKFSKRLWRVPRKGIYKRRF